MPLHNSILVTGSHRSGTTWLGNILCLAENTRYVQEPFNKETNADLEGYKLSNMFAHAPDEHEDVLERQLLHYLKPQPTERLVLKDPIALFSAPWLQDRFGLQVVCIVRHPAGFVSSLIKWQWEFHFGYLTAQPKLMETFDPEIRAEVEKYAQERQEPILQACLLWKLIYGWLLQQKPRRRNWIFVKYEKLANAPVGEFRKLYRKLGLKWTPEIAAKVQELSGEKNPKESDDPGFKARSSKAMREVWMKRLSHDQIELIRSKTHPVWSKFYHFWDWGKK